MGRLDRYNHGKRKKASEAQAALGFNSEAICCEMLAHNLSLILDFPATGQSQRLRKRKHAFYYNLKSAKEDFKTFHSNHFLQ